MNAARAILGHANYPGDATGAVGQLVGLSGFGEHLVVVDATRTESGTRLAFSIATLDDRKAFFARAEAKIADRHRHLAFFGGGA